ncbi:MAG: 6-phosphofructokinase [Clostridiales bacterium]|nr:6-phosphofructokinase [Clostridiales bacterium]
MDTKLRRVGILTSGGDAPGMNAAIRAVVRSCQRNGIVPIGIRRGFAGLIRSDTEVMDARSVNGITHHGGTVLYTARCEEFKTEEGIQAAAKACRYLGLDAVLAIGGDGTFHGLRALSRQGVNVIGVPATIDNDIGCSHYTIGFDTAANTAIEAIDKLADTMQSHERVSVVEVMGRHAGHLAVYVGLAVGATSILIPESEFDFERDVIEQIREGRERGKRHHLIIVAEGIGRCDEIVARVTEETGIETRVSILGYIQRGGSPSARDRVMASRMGHFAVEQLVHGAESQIVCYRDSQLIAVPVETALTMTKSLDMYMHKVAYDISI